MLLLLHTRVSDRSRLSCEDSSSSTDCFAACVLNLCGYVMAQVPWLRSDWVTKFCEVLHGFVVGKSTVDVVSMNFCPRTFDQSSDSKTKRGRNCDGNCSGYSIAVGEGKVNNSSQTLRARGWYSYWLGLGIDVGMQWKNLLKRTDRMREMILVNHRQNTTAV